MLCSDLGGQAKLAQQMTDDGKKAARSQIRILPLKLCKLARSRSPQGN